MEHTVAELSKRLQEESAQRRRATERVCMLEAKNDRLQRELAEVSTRLQAQTDANKRLPPLEAKNNLLQQELVDVEARLQAQAVAEQRVPPTASASSRARLRWGFWRFALVAAQWASHLIALALANRLTGVKFAKIATGALSKVEVLSGQVGSKTRKIAELLQQIRAKDIVKKN